MSQTLTQKEIDLLLCGTTSLDTPATAEPIESAEIVAYNFMRPPRVNKDRRSTLESIHTRFALSMQVMLTSRLRTPIDLVLSSVEQANFSEFILSLASPCAAYVFKIGDRLGSQGVIDFSTDVAYHLVDRMFGGPGEPCEIRRSLTPLEQTVVRGLADRAVGLLRDAWQGQLEMNPEVVMFESIPDMLQITSREDTVLLMTLELRSGGFSGFITVCLPMGIIEQSLQSRQAARQLQSRSGGADASGARALVEASLKTAQLSLQTRLPIFRLSAREVNDLQAGQVIQTGLLLDIPVEVLVNSRLSYLGFLGQRRRRVCLRITQPVTTSVTERSEHDRQGRVL
jgi:flagellar motor switch protein FliM